MGRAVILLVIAAGVVGAVALDGGWMPGVSDVVAHLASRPEVSDRFGDPAYGRFDATVFFFTCVLATPFVLLALVAILALAHMLLEATLLPVGRKIGLPDGFVVTMATLVVAVLAYARTELWLPPSLSVLALIARAWVVSTTT
jgi:hypothetical protein